jgi:hypothetical protein
MTNLERIRKMKLNELIIFLKMCDFTSTMPVIEGERFHNRKELEDWFKREANN